MYRRRRIFLVANNFSEQLGGEAIKPLMFFRRVNAPEHPVTVITHARNRAEILTLFDGDSFVFVEDGPIQKFLWHSRLLRSQVDVVFHLQARAVLRRLAAEAPDAVIHYMSPVSPIVPRFAPNEYTVVIGPLTGNIYYPPAFHDREPFNLAVGRRLHDTAQRFGRVLFNDRRKAARILVSGGARTRRSLRLAGCRDAQMVDVIDSGVSDRISDRPPIHHRGQLHRFVCNGRFMPHKGIDLAIRAIARTETPAELDIFGRGREEANLRALVERLNLGGRVRFMGWAESNDALLDAMRAYRGFLFPTLAEANGIVMQEAMAMGLPTVTLRWGGPAMLADDDSAIFVDPEGEAPVIDGLARAMDSLGRDADLANRLAANGRAIAERRFTWDRAAAQWMDAYPD